MPARNASAPPGPIFFAPLHIRDLLQAPVALLDLPTRLGKLQPPQLIHLQFVAGPVLRRTVLGNDPEHLRPKFF